MPFSSLKNVDPDIVPQTRTTASASAETKRTDSDHDAVDKNCKYLSCNDFAGELVENEGLSVFHANMRSLPKNIDNLRELFNGCAKLPDIIAITESKVNSKTDKKLLKIEGYKPFKDDSKTSAGGV